MVVLRKGKRLRVFNTAGFTLIELMISLSIIVLVMAIAIPNFQAAAEKAQQVGCDSNQKIILGHIENYYMEENQYPLITEAEHEEKEWKPLDMEMLKSSGYFREVVQCPRGGMYLVKLGESGRVEEIMCSVQGSLTEGEPD